MLLINRASNETSAGADEAGIASFAGTSGSGNRKLGEGLGGGGDRCKNIVAQEHLRMQKVLH